jgi:tRNA 2-thiouridine synthesizing protein A
MKTRNALARLAIGGAFTVLATDPMSAIDVPHAATHAGGRVVGQSEDGVLVFEIVRERLA